MESYELESLFDFKRGIPSVHGIMFGDAAGDADDVQYMLQDGDVEDENEKWLLRDLKMEIGFVYSVDDFLESVEIKVPQDKVSVDDIKDMFWYFCGKMAYTDKDAQYTYDYDDELIDLDAYIEDAYFKITFSMDNDNYYIVIDTKSEDTHLYQTLAYLAREGYGGLLIYISNMIENPDLNGVVHEEDLLESIRKGNNPFK